jgi:hypothetical protein
MDRRRSQVPCKIRKGSKMQWFKHDTDASNDAKIKKLIIKHGAIGYAIYFHCLELIGGNISESNITFELEHDSEIISDNLKIKGDLNKSAKETVEEIMRYIIELGLFEEKGGHVFCFRMLKRLDMSMTSNPRLREIISGAKKNHDNVMINHDSTCKKRREEKRRDKNRTEEKGAAVAAVLADLRSPELKVSLEAWIESRKASKSPVTVKALELGIDTLNKMYPGNIQSQIECVNQTVISGWKGFFPLKNNNQKPASQTYDTEARKRELAAMGYK